MADLLVLQRLAENLQNCADFSGKTSAYWARRKGKSGLNTTKLAVCKRKKEHSHLSKSPDCKVGESQNEREPNLDKKEGEWSRSMRRKEWTPQ